MKRILLPLIVLYLFPLKAYATGGNLGWVKSAGGEYVEEGRAIDALADGSTLVTGLFHNSSTFGPGEAGETTLTSAGSDDIFIARYNDNGTLAWAKRAGGTSSDRGNGIVALNDGSALMTGWFYESATFGMGEEGETTLTSARYSLAIFIARFNPDGTLAWAKHADGAGSRTGRGIAALADGSTVVTGDFYESATFGPGEEGETTLTAADYHDIFIAKFGNTFPLRVSYQPTAAATPAGYCIDSGGVFGPHSGPSGVWDFGW